jgi:hypothetical protein
VHKYPRTRHLAGSRLQPGDEDLSQVPFAEIRGRHLVVEEKLDGANAGISFTAEGELRLQSRGHYLTGGPRERHFGPMKSWATALAPRLWPVLTDRYVLYGEWLYAKHTVFYNALPHYFCEFDVLDLHSGQFLSTPRRGQLLAALPIVSVPVLQVGTFGSLAELTGLVRASTCRTPQWRQSLALAAAQAGVDPAVAARETDDGDDMEGLYLKVEEDDRVVDRLKWIRSGFLQAMLGSGSHWLERPIIANRLADPEAMYAGL